MILNIYCHYDGYLDYNGKILLKYYNTYDKALNLIKRGSISNFERNGNPNYYEEKPVFSKNLKAFDREFKHSDQEYLYLFAPDKNGNYRWIYKENTYVVNPTYEICGDLKYLISYQTNYIITKYRELNEKEIYIENLAAACYITGLRSGQGDARYNEYFEMIKQLTMKQLNKARNLDQLARYQTKKYLRNVVLA